MTIGKRASGKALTMPAGLALGTIGSLGITLVASVLAAKLVDIGTLQEVAIGYIAMAILLLASFAGCMISVGKIKRQKLMVCGLSAAIYYATLLAATAMFFGGQYRGMGVTALLILCGGGVAVLTVTGQGRGGRKKYSNINRHR